MSLITTFYWGINIPKFHKMFVMRHYLIIDANWFLNGYCCCRHCCSCCCRLSSVAGLRIVVNDVIVVGRVVLAAVVVVNSLSI